MRKIAMYAIALLLAMGTVSCTKEGPAGKDGIDGKDGKDGRDGKDGKNGNVIITGNGAPDAGLGNVGDYYFDRTTSNLYGAKTTNGWGAPVSLKGLQGEKGDTGNTGADGNKILYGTIAPTANLGNIGDWYIDTQNGRLYGAKTAQGWGSGISLSGGGSDAISPSDYKLSADGKTLILWMNLTTRNIDMNADPNLSQVTTIEKEAFVDCNNLNSIIISNSVKTIKPKAFANLRRLSSVELGSGVQSIASINKEYNYYKHDTITSGAFYNCTSLKSITIPKQLKDISGAFKGCTDLTSVVLEEGVVDIEAAFIGCSKLSTITIPNSVENIEGAFVKCKNLETVSIGNGVLYWINAFEECKKLKNVTLPEGVTTIGNQAFSGSGLTSITIPNSVTRIGDSAFSGTPLTSIVIPNSVTRIGDNVFAGSGLTSIVIPNSVTRIGDNVFAGSGLTSVVIPNSVTELGNRVFADCEKLISVTLSNQMTTIKGGDYSGTFSNCPMLTTLTIPANITTIETGAFQNSGLTTVTLEATTPPQMENYRGLFFNRYVDIYSNDPTEVKTVYVPASSLSAYQNAEGWKELSNKGITIQTKP